MTLTDNQVATAALNVVDEYLDVSLDTDFVRDSVREFFKDGWTNPGEEEAGEDAGPENVEFDAEDLGRVHEEVESILRYLSSQAEGYYDA